MKTVGIQRAARRMNLRYKKCAETAWLGRDFGKYLMDKRLPNMWRNQGRVTGPWGAGSEKWADNAPSTVKKKGFNKPLFGRPSRSGIQAAYHFTHRRRGKGWRAFWLSNSHVAADWLQDDYTWPARWIEGFIQGDLKWLSAHAVKEGVKI